LNIAKATSQPLAEETIVSVSDFGATPNDEINDRESINRALDYCKKKGIDKLYFPPGKYILSHPDAIALMNAVMDLKI